MGLAADFSLSDLRTMKSILDRYVIDNIEHITDDVSHLYEVVCKNLEKARMDKMRELLEGCRDG